MLLRLSRCAIANLGFHAMAAIAMGAALPAALPHLAQAAILDRITTTTLTLPANLEPTQSSWCTWEYCSISPRLYHVPLSDGRTLIGWTDGSLNGHVSVVIGSSISATFTFPAKPVRGLFGHDDGSFAVVLWDRGTAAAEDDIMLLSRRTAAGVEQWATRVTSATNVPSAAGYNVGDSRLAYGGGIYGAYMSVHGISGFAAGHEGDEYTRVSESGSILAGGWTWGLSHSLAQLIASHPDGDALTLVGSSDCYPGKGLYADHTRLLWASDGNCAGYVQAQLGQMAAALGRRWLVAFSAPDRAGFPAQGIGLARFGPTGSPVITWLTNTTGAEERDPVLARIGTALGSNRFLVGWRMTSSGQFKIGVVDTLGVLVEAPEVVSPTVKWGNRDDSFRTRPDGSVSWVQGDAGSNTLRLYRYTDAAVDAPSAGVTPSLELEALYPNPLHDGVARIRFRLDAARPVSLRIVDGAGRLVKELARGWRPPGPHEIVWDGRDAGGAAVSPGVYFCSYEAGGRGSARKVVVVR